MCAVVASKAAALHRPIVETRSNEGDDAERVAREKLAAKVQADPAVVKAKGNLAGIRRLGLPLDPEPVDALAGDFHD